MKAASTADRAKNRADKGGVSAADDLSRRWSNLRFTMTQNELREDAAGSSVRTRNINPKCSSKSLASNGRNAVAEYTYQGASVARLSCAGLRGRGDAALDMQTELNDSGGWSDGITWDEMQAIKDGCGFADHDAVEAHPKRSDITNLANMRHLWVVPPKYAQFFWRMVKGQGLRVIRPLRKSLVCWAQRRRPNHALQRTAGEPSQDLIFLSAPPRQATSAYSTANAEAGRAFFRRANLKMFFDGFVDELHRFFPRGRGCDTTGKSGTYAPKLVSPSSMTIVYRIAQSFSPACFRILFKVLSHVNPGMPGDGDESRLGRVFVNGDDCHASAPGTNRRVRPV